MADSDADGPPEATDGSGLGEVMHAAGQVDEIVRAQLLASVERDLFGRDDDPVSVGRYDIVERLGSGGQGVVYLAHDPRLDRQVAVKLVRVDARENPDALRRLLREASTLAQLSHPNVVAVNDVGECSAGVFVVTELVEGLTLHAWIREKPRTLAEILDAFRQAGEGLAAAHARGLVHRDFKPGNVLVGSDGRVRLLDFGLAREATTDDRSGPERVAAALPSDSGGIALRSVSAPYVTRSDIVMGTPAYMAPEQWRRLGDARVDQFAFGIALWEALAGRRPFRVEAGGRHFERGLVVPEHDAVPAWLRAVIVRATAIDPGERYPDMPALLAALQVPRRRRVVRLALGAIAAVGIAAILVPSRDDPCERAGAALLEVWTDARREAMRGALGDGDEASARALATRIDADLDAWATGWAQTQAETCAAIFERGELSDAALDRSTRCLARRLDGFDALVDVLATADGSARAHAAMAVARLPDPRECSREQADEPTPDDPTIRDQVEAVRRGLATVDAMHAAGQDDRTIVAAEAWLEEARTTGFAAVHAEALVRLGAALERNGRYKEAVQTLMAAHEEAVSARHDRVRAQTAVLTMFIHGARLADLDNARIWRGHAEAALASVPGSDELHVVFPSNLGAVALRAGHPREARADLERAAEACERILPPDHLDAALVHNNLGIALVQLGQRDEGLSHLERARTIWTTRLGPDHPDVATADANLAALLTELGRLDEALALAQTAVDKHERIHGGAHPTTAAAHLNLAAVNNRLGRFDDAVAEARTALTIRLAAYGEDHPTVVDNYNTLAAALHGQGHDDEAIAAFEQAIEIGHRVWGPRHPAVGPSLNNSVHTLLALGRTDLALERAREAIAIYTGAIADDDHRFAYAFTSLGLALLQRGDAAAAIEPLEHALALRDAAEKDPVLRAETRFALARARAATGSQADARALASAARDELPTSTPLGDRKRLAIERWLADRNGTNP